MPKKKTKRRYSDEDRANAIAALAANNGNVERTAKQLNIPSTTLDHWKKQQRHPEATKMGEQKIGSLADKMEDTVWLLLESCPPKIKVAPLRDAIIARACHVANRSGNDG